VRTIVQLGFSGLRLFEQYCSEAIKKAAAGLLDGLLSQSQESHIWPCTGSL
jgi:hypothetical protein